VTSMVTLAFQRWRRHWFLLLFMGVGMVAAVLIVCAVPLLTVVMQTSELRDVLTESPASSELTLRTTVAGLSSQTVTLAGQFARPPLEDHLKSYLKGSPQLEITIPDFIIDSPKQATINPPLGLDGNSIQEATAHVALVQGRLPRTLSEDIEIAVTPATARVLHVQVGSVMTVETTFYKVPTSIMTPAQLQQPYTQLIRLDVVGLFEVKPNDGFWHGKDFLPGMIGPVPHYTALASNQAVLAAFDKIAAKHGVDGVYFSSGCYAYLYWYYSLDPARIPIDRIAELTGQLTATQNGVAQANSSIRLSIQSSLQQVDLYGPVLGNAIIPSSLERFRDHIALARIPVAILMVLITCLMLFFVSVMAGLFVDRQTDAIAMLRSRGASDSQIFGSHVTQCFVLALLALLLGPFLAYMAAGMITRGLLSAAEQDVLGVLPKGPVEAFLSVKWYALVTVGVMMVVLIAALYRASHLHVLGMRRERTPWRPIWQRFNFDLIAAVIAFTGYGIAVYLTNIGGLLDVRNAALVSAPVALIAPVFLLVGTVLLFLRLLPWLLQIAARFAARGRGAAPMLAVAQLARSPRQSTRMIMVLVLATAFALFTLVFAASQEQRTLDIARYQPGADFSGNLPDSSAFHPLQEETKRYRNISGVLAATVGSISVETTGVPSAIFPLLVRAVDPETFAQATIWPAQSSSQPLSSLLGQLAGRRNAAIHQGIVPAIVDAYTWNRLALHSGEAFFVHLNSTLSDNAGNRGDDVRFVAIAEAQLMPTLSNSSGSDAGASLLSGNVIVDYNTFATIQKKYFHLRTPANYVWLRTSDDPAAVANVRRVLQASHMHLDNLNDRRALVDAMRSDPLYLNLIVVLALGTGAALLLALIGNLLASWLSVRTRLSQFVVLRALGAMPRQVTSILMWEQGLVYLMGLLIGGGFGVLLSLTVVPTLVIATTPVASVLGNLNSDEFYMLQKAFPSQVVFPLSLAIAFMVLFVICVAAVGVMARVALHPSVSPLLRLGEDQSYIPYYREEPFRVRAQAAPAQTAPRRTQPSFIALAGLWRPRQVWLLLMMIGAGMVAAIIVVCAIPLFSAVMTTADLRNTLNASPQNTEITLDAATSGGSTQVVQGLQQQLDPYFQRHIGTYLERLTPLSISASGFTYDSPTPPRETYEVNLFAVPIERATSHFTLLLGRFPQTTSGAIETILTPTEAASLHMSVGSVMKLHFSYTSQPQGAGRQMVPPGMLNLRVVGIVKITSQNDYLWHGNTFQPIPEGQTSLFTLLIPDASLLAALNQLATAAHTNAVFLPNGYELLWDYHLDTSRITYNQLTDLTDRLTLLQADIQNRYGNIGSVPQAASPLRYPYLLRASVYEPVYGSLDILSILERNLSRVDVFRIPAGILALQIIGLILLFMSFMADILVDCQANALAVLRSRGASSRQIAVSLIAQGVVLGGIALVVGPPLAMIAVSLISWRILGPKEQAAITTITGHPLQAALDVGWYAAATVLVVVVAMSLLLRRAATMNILSLRRETARPVRSAFLHHLSLEGGAAVIALTAYGLSAYLSNIGNQLDSGTKTLFLAPLMIVASIFFNIGIMILFLRFFPFLLRLGAWLTARGRGAVSMLALAQMARSPRYAVRTILLLALATALAIFTIVFSASQAQRIADISAYEVGADFSGDIAHSIEHRSVDEEMANYKAIAGVTSATIGYTAAGSALGTIPEVPVQVKAVDADTFGRTGIWTTQDSPQPLAPLMAQLVDHRYQAIQGKVVPAIVDATAAKELTLGIGSPLTINIGTLPYPLLNCIVVAEVQHIPAINNNAVAGSVSPAGILIDYETYARFYHDAVKDNHIKADPQLPFNHVWLRTSDAPTSVARVRAALQTKDLQLDNLYDRRALSNELHSDPLYLGLVAFLTLGAITALLLALLGDWLASWLSARNRLTIFAVLRAQGATPWQVAAVLTWEQVVISAVAIMLGSAFGAVLAKTVVPAMLFTNIPTGSTPGNLSTDEFYVLQQVLPPQVVIPSSLDIVLPVSLVIFGLAIAVMLWLALQPPMGRMLRLNED
jgi:ABC-type lipoprotein release transport system permease subunit